jgi:phosphohistidine phosphatase SixA
VKVFVVRHAKAGDRDKWTEPDEIRPVTKSGRRQAEALVDLLASERISRIVSSAYLRCVQTVEPLAAARGLEVEGDDALAEGAPLDAALQLIDRVGDGGVHCTHGDVMDDLIAHLARRGVAGADPSLMKKGSTWVLEGDDGAFTRATYLPPPA